MAEDSEYVLSALRRDPGGDTLSPPGAIEPPVVRLDVETLVKASQALSSEMILPRLVERLMRVALEHAGAERGLLILMRSGEPRIEAEAATLPDSVEVTVRDAPVKSSQLAQSVLRHVIRTREPVLLGKRSRSVLCVPILKQATLVGALYLESTLTPGAFMRDRLTALQLLASQAAISLDNAALYTELQRREAFLAHALLQAQSDLARINRVTTMGELTAAMAHELSQPITGVVTNANVCLRRLASRAPDLDALRTAVTRLARDAHRAAEIINGLRAQFEPRAMARETLRVSEIVRDTVRLLRREALRHSVAVRVELAPDLPAIAGDRVQLQQVTMNLIVNGIDAMKDVEGPREMVVQLRRGEGGHVLVSVSDNGSGFPTELAERIFEPFFTTKPHGTGMGLRISRSIVESHGGRLWAEGGAGRGATFYLSLPAVNPEQGPAPLP